MHPIDIKQVARLARLHLTPEEIKFFEGQVGNILSFIDQLKEVNVEGVGPTSHPLSLSNVFREDVVVPSLSIEPFLAKSPRARGRFFEVPKIIEDK